MNLLSFSPPRAIPLATGEDCDLRLIPEEGSMDTRIKGNDIQLVKVRFKRGLYTSSTVMHIVTVLITTKYLALKDSFPFRDNKESDVVTYWFVKFN
ncbi:hypothetical protein TNCT_188151 [Trichonephila clavata]|uniref:Uncharacterized protein n=1 Tax=Trichonephila clavata TaxID=2740835 RepID=A0A8X6K2E3_TRICU|nr:hypothetical protein TNCT_188151 [Trichonephila clavata]